MINLKNAKKLHEVAKKYGVELPYPSRATTEFRFPLYTTDELLEWLGKYTYGNAGIQLYAYNLNGGSIHDKRYSAIKTDVITNLNYDDCKIPADALCLLAIELINKKIIK